MLTPNRSRCTEQFMNPAISLDWCSMLTPNRSRCTGAATSSFPTNLSDFSIQAPSANPVKPTFWNFIHSPQVLSHQPLGVDQAPPESDFCSKPYLGNQLGQEGRSLLSTSEKSLIFLPVLGFPLYNGSVG